MLPDIYLVAQQIGIKFKHVSDTEIMAQCPVCDDKKGHMNIDRIKQCWRCPRCGSSGGVYGLVEATFNVSHEKAKEMIHHMNFPRMEQNSVKINKDTSKEVPLAPIEVRDRVYRQMLSMLNLNLAHQENLRSRGLSDTAIAALKFKSTPGRINYEIPRKLVAIGCNLSGVPGFFEHEGKWAMYCITKGYFIPFLQDGLMFALQIRSDNANLKRRYRWFSSKGFYHGCRVIGLAHEISLVEGATKVCLTEGALKADVASFLHYKLTGEKLGFIALAGASSKSVLKKELMKLKAKGVTEIIEALDMDKIGNESIEKKIEVEIALKGTVQTIQDCGMIYTPTTWKCKKGIDDFLLYRMQCSTSKRAS